MTTDSLTFESTRAQLAAAPPAKSEDQRRIKWFDRGQTAAFSRDPEGCLEIFLAGPEIKARDANVRKRLVHDVWLDDTDRMIEATRLRLPPGEHVDAAAAAIVAELFDKGWERDRHRAFRDTEPLIALILQRARSEEAVLTGLAGELLTLDALLAEMDPTAATSVIDAWHGWRQSTRDFQLGNAGVEVKATTASASRHKIQGWYQVEPGAPGAGVGETSLYLLSIGVRWLKLGDAGQTIESLVEGILTRLREPQQQLLVERVRGYCGAEIDISDDGRAGQQSLRRPFYAAFERLYDMRDPRIEVLHSVDLSEFAHVVSDSVHFEIELPTVVDGDLNPVKGREAVVRVLASLLRGA